MKPVLVELAGAPGSGKSTLVDTVCAALGDRGLVAYERQTARAVCLARAKRSARMSIAIAALRFAARHAPLVAASVRALARSRTSRAERARGLKLFVRDGAHHDLFRTWLRDGEAVVFPEGLVQRLVTLAIRRGGEMPAPDVVAPYVNALPSIDLLLLLTAPLDVCAARLEHRRLPLRIANLDREGRRCFIDASAQLLAGVTDTLATRHVGLVRVSTAASMTTTRAMIRSALRAGAMGPEAPVPVRDADALARPSDAIEAAT
jgi:hypothetical protein